MNPKHTNKELLDILGRIFYQGYYKGRDEGYSKSFTVSVGEALKAINELMISREEVEAETRYKIHKDAPKCEHGLDEEDHQAYCGFINNIWTNWAIKNNAEIDHKTGRAKLNLKPLLEIRRGTLTRPDVCSINNKDCQGKIHAHHDDYSKPAEVRWLCSNHHCEVHNGFLARGEEK